MINQQHHVSGKESSDMPTYFQTKIRNASDTSSTSAKRLGKRIVEEKIGNSYESPSYFRTQHGKLSTTTYNNPFINMKVDPVSPPIGTLKNSQTCNVLIPIKKEQYKDIFNLKELQTPSSYNLLTHQKTKSEKVVLQINERAKFNEDYEKISKNAASPFHRKTNYFSDFAERNDIMNVFGGINQRERPTEFSRVKDFALDQQQQELQKTIRQNSQPSLMPRSHNNSFYSSLTPRVLSNKNNNTNTNTASQNEHQATMEFQILTGQQLLESKTPKTNRLFGSPRSCRNSFKNMNYQSSGQGSNKNTPNNDELTESQIIQTSKGMGTFQQAATLHAQQQQQQSQLYINSDITNTNNSPMNTTNLQTTKSRFFGNRGGSFLQPNHHKVSPLTKLEPVKIKVDKRESIMKKNLEEETAEELKNIDEFEHHLKFAKGSNFTDNTQGSVFFRDQKKQ